ncbi:MAG TPA: M36 family metallopeptidase [Pyrinomonadaceae bacterium]|nr:M36 family metallopeptidase [Pyrinomonadaceae bacterium]
MIIFIPNDPLAKVGPDKRKIKPHAKRAAGGADFVFNGVAKEGIHDISTPEFLFWQCREAALRAVEVWETIDGKLKAWGTSSPKKLALTPNAGFQLNAGYTQAGLDFYEFTTGNKSTFSGASTDVVSHESGHAFLDVLRPELWTSTFPETNAFHEAFGDCMAILTALSDKETRTSLLAVTKDLSKPNFVETLMEDLADGTKREYGADFDSSAPRHALNNFKWQLPSALPKTGKPAVLTSEVHSFGRVFAGCFYDALRNIFASQPKHDQANLWKAAQTLGKILAAAAREAPETPRFFQSIGRAMVLADKKLNDGANQKAIGEAFTQHDISLGSAAMLAPRSSLAGAPPKMKGKGASILTPSTRDDLKRLIGAPPKARLEVSTRSIGDEQIAEATHIREVSLDSLSKDLKGVVTFAAEPVLVGSSGKRAAVVSALPNEGTTTDEVHTFVATLLESDAIDFDGSERTAAPAKGFRAAGAVGGKRSSRRRPLPTHVIRLRGNQKVLERIRFV